MAGRGVRSVHSRQNTDRQLDGIELDQVLTDPNSFRLRRPKNALVLGG